MQEMLRQLHTIGAFHRHLLPRKVPHLPGWNLAVHYTAGHWPGGTYYDFFSLPDGRLLFLVAAANDHGPPSVALVSILRVVLHSCPLSSGVERLPFCPFREPLAQPPHIVLGHLNRVLVENSLEEQFMTAFCGLVSPADGELRFANAGHLPPLWWHAESGAVERLREAGLPLGLNPMAAYHHKRIDLEPGDVLVCYSAGIGGAQNHQGQRFEERLDDLLVQAAPEGAEAVKEKLVAGLNEFLGRNPPAEDVTLVILEKRE
jgi:sigma-B regulation protein RsbU (phosphoserine phosphatase)